MRRGNEQERSKAKRVGRGEQAERVDEGGRGGGQHVEESVNRLGLMPQDCLMLSRLAEGSLNAEPFQEIETGLSNVASTRNFE